MRITYNHRRSRGYYGLKSNIMWQQRIITCMNLQTWCSCLNEMKHFLKIKNTKKNLKVLTHFWLLKSRLCHLFLPLLGKKFEKYSESSMKKRLLPLLKASLKSNNVSVTARPKTGDGDVITGCPTKIGQTIDLYIPTNGEKPSTSMGNAWFPGVTTSVFI